MNTTQGEASVGKKKKRVRIELVFVFEDDGTIESVLSPLNKKKRSGNTSQQPIQEVETKSSSPHPGTG